MRALRVFVALACMLLPVEAQATIFGAWNEPCLIETTPQPTPGRWLGYGTNKPTTITSGLDTMPGNLCAAKFAPASGATDYILPVAMASAQGTLNLSCRLKVLTVGTTTRRLTNFRGASEDGAILTLNPVSAQNANLTAWYRSTTGYVCSGSTRNDTPCTPVVDPSCNDQARDTTNCPENNHCESTCVAAKYADVEIPVGSWNAFTLRQKNGTDDSVDVGLWSGTGGVPSNVYPRGTTNRLVGICAAGASAGYSCGADSDCPASTCTDHRVTITQPVIGTDDTVADGGWSYVLDGCFWYDGNVVANSYWETTLPLSDGERGNWHSFLSGGAVRTCDDTHLFDCLNDGTAIDGTLSTLENTQAAKPTAIINFAAISTPTPAPTPLAILAELDMQQAENGTATVDLEFVSGATTTSDFADFVDIFADNGTSAAFHNLPPLLSENATILANLSAVHLQFKRTGSGGNKMRFTDATVSVLRQTADPPIPAIIPDLDADGEDTLCIVGDSIIANEELWNKVNARVIEPTNLYFCSLGGTMIQDMTDRYSFIVEGNSGGYLKCSKKRGQLGKTCDVILEMFGVNNVHQKQVGKTDNPTSLEGGLGQNGWCESGGADQGHACECGDSTLRRTDPARGSHGYCVTKGTGAGAFGASCYNSSDCVCASNADCSFNGGTGICGYCEFGSNAGQTCSATSACPGGRCTFACQNCATTPGCINAGDNCRADRTPPNRRASWCNSGCKDSPDCSGTCVTSNKVQWAKDDFLALVATHDAYPTPAKTPNGRPAFVAVAPPPPIEGQGVGCWGSVRTEIEEYDRWLIDDWGKADSVRLWIDARRAVKLRTPSLQGTCADTSCFFTDSIHPNDFGRGLLADLFTECVTNTPLGAAVGSATHDGLCVATKCTRGRVDLGSCSVDGDCDTWRCAFPVPS